MLLLLDGSSRSPGLSRQAAWRPRPPSRPGASFSLLGFIFCPFQRDVEGVLSPATFHYENRDKLGRGGNGDRLWGPAPEGLRPLLPWSRRGGVPPRACLLVRGWQKFKLVKSGLVPRGGEKRPGSPSPSRAWRRLAQPQGRPRPPLAPRGPTPGAAPRPLPGRSGGPSSMKEIPLLSLAWGWTPLPAGGGVQRMGRGLVTPPPLPLGYPCTGAGVVTAACKP